MRQRARLLECACPFWRFWFEAASVEPIATERSVRERKAAEGQPQSKTLGAEKMRLANAQAPPIARLSDRIA